MPQTPLNSPAGISGPDGIPRSPAEQSRINELMALVFKGEAGRAAMDYLRSISIERACGPFATDAELRHLEGMRFLVGVISQRISAAHKEKELAARSGPDTIANAFANPRPGRRSVRRNPVS